MTVHLALLFSCMAKHCYVPDGFSQGVIEPLIQKKFDNVNDTNNYRGIALIPVL